MTTLNDPASTGTGNIVTVVFRTKNPDGTLGSAQFRDWTAVRLTRSLHELFGSFELEYDDRVRAAALRPPAPGRMALPTIDPLQPVKIFVDGELVLVGYVEEVSWEVDAGQLRARLHGLDPCGDLLECTANPAGPAEYKGLTVLQIAQRLVQPYGITVRTEVDVGAPVADYALDVGETVFSALDKACKLRAVLVTSDGIGAMVLTRSGSRRAPAPIDSTKAISFGLQMSSKDRYSDYFVKGQARTGSYGSTPSGSRPGAAPGTGTAHPLPGPNQAPMNSGSVPLPSRGAEGSQTALAANSGTAYQLGAGPAIATPPSRPISVVRAASILNVGHAVDPVVTRYRPRVLVARTGAGGAPHQVLAEWRMRIARARAERRHFVVPDFRAGPDVLWRPNEVVAVHWLGQDPYDMLIEGVVFVQDFRGGSRTELAVVGTEAYDLEPLPDEHRRHRNGTGGRGASVNKIPT